VLEVQSTPVGQRNNVLARVAFGLGRLEHLGLDRVRVLEALEEAALSTGLSLQEARTTARRAWAKGAQHPRDLPPSSPFPAKGLAENQTRWLSPKSDFTPNLTTQWDKLKGGW
jgi:hypothetical protein